MLLEIDAKEVKEWGKLNFKQNELDRFKEIRKVIGEIIMEGMANERVTRDLLEFEDYDSSEILSFFCYQNLIKRIRTKKEKLDLNIISKEEKEKKIHYRMFAYSKRAKTVKLTYKKIVFQKEKIKELFVHGMAEQNEEVKLLKLELKRKEVELGNLTIKNEIIKNKKFRDFDFDEFRDEIEERYNNIGKRKNFQKLDREKKKKREKIDEKVIKIGKVFGEFSKLAMEKDKEFISQDDILDEIFNMI